MHRNARAVVSLLILICASATAARNYVFDAVAVNGGIKASDEAVYNELELNGCAIGHADCNENSARWKVYCRSDCFVLSKGTKVTIEPKTVKTRGGAETQVKVCGRFIGPDAPKVCFSGIVSEFEQSTSQN